MWYLVWILGTLLACSTAIIVALIIERNEMKKTGENIVKSDDNGD